MPFLSRRGLVLLGVFCLIPLFNFPLALLSDRTLFLRDIAMVWAPQAEAVVQQVGRGEWPFFDARRAFGQPLFADPRSEVLYPPSWIHWVLPPETSYALFSAFHLILAALGAARLARRFVPDASTSALAVAGLAYGAGGPLLSLVSHWHHLAGAAWMPWILELAEPDPRGDRRWVTLAALVALQVFAGSPDYTFTTFCLCLLRLATRGEQSGTERTRTLMGLSLGLCLSAVQLLPSLAFAREAARDPLPIGWAISPLHPALSLESVLPIRVESWPLRPEARAVLLGDAQVWMFSHYLGLSIWILAGFGMFHSGPRACVFALSCIALGFLFAWGIRSEALQSLVAHVPLISGLRFPTKHLAASSLGLALLAAQGMMTARPWAGRFRNRALALLIGVFIATAALFAWSTNPDVPFDLRSLPQPAIAVASVLGILLCAGKFDRAWLAVPVLVVIDLLGTQTRLNPTTNAAFFKDRPPLTTTIPRDSRIYVSDYSTRIRSGPIRMPARPAYKLGRVPLGFEHAEALALAALWYLNPPSASRFGYYGSFDIDVLDFYRAPLKKTIETFVMSRDPEFIHRSLRRGSVDYVVTMDEPALWSSLPLIVEESLFFENTVRVYKVPDPWPRARFETPEGDLDQGLPRILEMSDSRIRIETISAKPTRLVIAVANDRGWRASVDGAGTAVLDNPMSFIAVPLPEGNHLVELTYRPPLLDLGAAVSALSVGVALVFAARGRSRPRG